MKKNLLLMGVIIAVIAVTSCATMARSTEEVFLEHHKMVETLGPDEADIIAADYADDAVLIMGDGTKLVGKEAIEAGFQGFLSGFPGLDYTKSTHYIEDDWVMVVWEGTSDVGKFVLSIDGFLIQNGKIKRQICWFDFVPNDR